ncbi:hypothetical protein BDV25DRAFT_154853 [Aspergillus avenaceus]|uniref:Uncharacterized protein n=1 Tax=Aspergillus avenaceus TaxID=36643 RepID=A0A5N6TV41_ASPAV|nr:hypothetical protein BDV25DRAFT_154853 [Aspergillus avenaceus]
MSAGQSYLQKLRKPQLAEWAAFSDLHDYEEYNKPELIVALDKHLQANQSIFSNDPRLAEYYKRLTQSPRKGSPLKREPQVELTPLRDAPRSVRRRQTKPKEEVVEEEQIKLAEDSEASSPVIPALFQTPARSPQTSSIGHVDDIIAPSPAALTNAIDRQTTRMWKGLADLWFDSKLPQASNSLRSSLSSVQAVHYLLLLLEGFHVAREALPLRYVTTVRVWLSFLSAVEIHVPDVFALLEGSFWAPFSLWVLTSVALPLTAAYFFNIRLNVKGNARSRQDGQFDPLSYTIAKGLISYLVYGRGFNFWNIYDPITLERVNSAVPGQVSGLFLGCSIGAIGSIYEEILRK